MTELIIVMVLIGILAAWISFPKPDRSLNVNAQAAQLANDIRYTQALAMTQSQHFYLKITGSTYQILSAAGTPQPLVTGETTATLGRDLSFGTYTTTLPNSLIGFSGNGTPYTDCAAPATCATTAPLAVQANIPIQSSGAVTVTVTVQPETGSVSTQ